MSRISTHWIRLVFALSCIWSHCADAQTKLPARHFEQPVSRSEEPSQNTNFRDRATLRQEEQWQETGITKSPSDSNRTIREVEIARGARPFGRITSLDVSQPIGRSPSPRALASINRAPQYLAIVPTSEDAFAHVFEQPPSYPEQKSFGKARDAFLGLGATVAEDSSFGDRQLYDAIAHASKDSVLILVGHYAEAKEGQSLALPRGDPVLFTRLYEIADHAGVTLMILSCDSKDFGTGALTINEAYAICNRICTATASGNLACDPTAITDAAKDVRWDNRAYGVGIVTGEHADENGLGVLKIRANNLIRKRSYVSAWSDLAFWYAFVAAISTLRGIGNRALRLRQSLKIVPKYFKGVRAKNLVSRMMYIYWLIAAIVRGASKVLCAWLSCVILAALVDQTWAFAIARITWLLVSIAVYCVITLLVKPVESRVASEEALDAPSWNDDLFITELFLTNGFFLRQHFGGPWIPMLFSLLVGNLVICLVFARHTKMLIQSIDATVQARFEACSTPILAIIAGVIVASVCGI